MTVKTSPRPVVGALTHHEPLEATRWASRWPEDGILSDFSALAWRVQAGGSSRTVSIGAATDTPQTVVVRGHLGELTTSETRDLGVLGVQPSGTQERFSRIVARFHRAGALLNTITIEVIPGSPAAIGSGATPPPLRSLSAWDFCLATVRQQGSAAISQVSIADERSWLVDHVYLPDAAAITGSYPVGTVLERDTYTQRRIVTGSGSSITPGWRIDDREDTNWSQSTPSQYSGVIAWRRKRGHVSVQFELQSVTANSNGSVDPSYLTLSAGSTPTRNVFGWVMVAGSRMVRVVVRPSGVVQLLGLVISPGESLTGSVDFPV